ncbi:hypothetical protein MHBO_000548 [Bonamia ostreae]|uniref:L-type lectin-like domain-containing protein n=1 Tax=Bonamia ostreae TaxID=126728 RepID=A0ABV2AG00_9EUKA
MSGLIFCFTLISVHSINEENISEVHVHYPINSNADSKNFEYGGSTVATNHFIRLTPSVSNRFGWIKSTKAVESTIFRMDVALRFTGGNRYTNGDGIAIHFFDQPDDTDFFVSQYSAESFYGVNPSQRGFSVVIKTNEDGKVKIFISDNMKAKDRNIDDIFENNAGGSFVTGTCLLNSFGDEKNTIVINFFKEDVYIYFETDKLEFCAAAKLSKTFENFPRFGIGAMTSEQFNNHDIFSVFVKTSRSKNSNKSIDSFLKAGEKSFSESFRLLKNRIKRMFWFAAVISGMLLFLETVWELSLLQHVVNDKLVPKETLNLINLAVPYTNYVMIGLFVYTLLSFRILMAIFLAPIFAFKVYRLTNKKNVLKSDEFDYTKNFNGYSIMLCASVVAYVFYTFLAVGELVSF